MYMVMANVGHLDDLLGDEKIKGPDYSDWRAFKQSGMNDEGAPEFIKLKASGVLLYLPTSTAKGVNVYMYIH